MGIWRIGFGIVFSIGAVLSFASSDNDSPNSTTNAMMGMPEVTCTEEGLSFTMETERPFEGQLYVKDEYHNSNCRVNFKDVNRPGATFSLTFNECGMRRQRMLQPRGMMYSVTMMVQFHDIFVTENDHAYQVRCFYGDQQMNLTNSLDVSPLTTGVMEATFPFPSPSCAYSIRSKSTGGPLASVVKVGDPIIHVFSCNLDVETYRILVKDCYVDDGKTQRHRIIGPDGCSLDETIMRTLQYQNDKLEAYAESTAFKWPDESIVYFSCQVSLCVDERNACEGVTPPKCNEQNRSRRSNKSPTSQLEFDLEVKRLTVVENDAIRARPTSLNKRLNHGAEDGSRNLSMYQSTMVNANLPIVADQPNGTVVQTFASQSVVHEANGTVSSGLFWNARASRDNIYSTNDVCFGFGTVATSCVIFTLFLAVLMLITCKLCSPCCFACDHRYGNRNDGRKPGLHHGNFCLSNQHSNRHRFCGDCFGKSSIATEFEYRNGLSHQATDLPASLNAKELLFSKMNLEI